MPAISRRSVCGSPCARGAFTLIELLAVMAIILLLAGLILSIAGNAQYKAAMSRATTEVKAMETACESYKADNGAYPQGPQPSPAPATPTQTSTDALNAQSDVDPGSGSGSYSKYTAACSYLFQQLSGLTNLAASNPTTNPSKPYITFKPSQLSTGSAAPTSATFIMDPFGFCYGYSTANAYATANGTTTTTQGYNPTFDLWSTGGYSSSGKSYPTMPAGTSSSQAVYDSTLWAKNW